MSTENYFSVLYKIGSMEKFQGPLKLKAIPRFCDAVQVGSDVYYVELVRVCSSTEEHDATMLLSSDAPQEEILNSIDHRLNTNLSVLEDLSINLRKLDKIDDLIAQMRRMEY